jgi:transposase
MKAPQEVLLPTESGPPSLDSVIPTNEETAQGPAARYNKEHEKTLINNHQRPVVQELLKEDKAIAHIAAEYEVHPTQLNTWKSTALKGLASLFEDKDSLANLKATHEKQLNELYGEIGRLTTQLA